MSNLEYPEMLKKKIAAYNTGVVVFLAMSIVHWSLTDVVYAPLLGALFSLLIMAMKIKLLRRIRQKGFCWKQYKVIDYTHLTRWRRKPTGFIALSFNEGEPVKRYHFSLADSMGTPEIGAMLDICVPGDAKITEVGVTSFVSEYFGILYNGKSL